MRVSSRIVVFIVVSCLFAAWAVAPAQARLVQVGTVDAEAVPPRHLTKDETQLKGFQQAVLLEALAVLPVQPDEARRTLLTEYLDTVAKDFVSSFSEAGAAGKDAALLDVTVNRGLLKKRLQEIGVYYTVIEPRQYNLMLTGATPDAWDVLGRLQALSGLQVETGAMPSLSLEHVATADGPVWQGVLHTDKADYPGQDKSLDVLWFALWKHYFSRPELDNVAAQTVVLHVEGWYAPDGVDAFDRLLRGWDEAVFEAVLEGVSMRAAGLAATWRVKLRSKDALEQRLQDFLPSRNLTYAVADAAS
ncbi:MAG: hypothetical protein AB7E47_17520 [Desulfovibrionaceae bacterium]